MSMKHGATRLDINVGRLPTTLLGIVAPRGDYEIHWTVAGEDGVQIWVECDHQPAEMGFIGKCGNVREGKARACGDRFALKALSLVGPRMVRRCTLQVVPPREPLVLRPVPTPPFKTVLEILDAGSIRGIKKILGRV